MPPIAPIRRALISVSDKRGVEGFARALAQAGVHLLSTGGTARTLRDAGLPVTLVEEHTGFPEMLDGRVKTLHPKIHGGILGVRANPDHRAKMAAHGIEPIDLVCIDLYKFEDTVARGGVGLEEAVEQIDIGGPSMLRSAAKNFHDVTVVSDPGQYETVLAELREHGGTTLATRMDLAAAAFERTCAFDGAIGAYLRAQQGEAFPRVLTLQGRRAAELRYGENPHQPAALYADPASRGPSIAAAEQLHGKELSYNNLLDAAAALELAVALAGIEAGAAGACVIKHTNPCGAALATTPAEAFDLAIAGDPLAAYGGIAASSTAIDLAAAERICAPDRFFEVVIAPDFAPDALALLRDRWKNVRLLCTGPLAGRGAPIAGRATPDPADRGAALGAPHLDIRSIPGGYLVQAHDDTHPDPASWTHAAGPVPDPELLRAAALVEAAARALSSNAVAIGGPVGRSGAALFGGGAGQMDRVASCRLAVAKAGERARGSVAVSDAFFPFSDGPEILIDAGVAMIVHPGGSKRDPETFALCEARGVTCMTTGIRRFRH
ncbi:MAG TPA: bifunctional phosphoribosylaminoimidazolecarboxamide formyltransferase/IMP cyclohydrolase [Phycisphaerales bacterium]|nr:bifunctional phosphoribosylaminoimidazolecarboxamide formyltransferase/IMP cyclohydrolase [Phycisphaerales bacterium]